MSNAEQMHNDLDEYIATFTEKERQELALAEATLDLADLLYQVRKARGLTQKTAAQRTGMQQQAISRWEHAHPNVQLGTLQKYLAALGYDLGLVITDSETGEIVATTGLTSSASSASTHATTDGEIARDREDFHEYHEYHDEPRTADAYSAWWYANTQFALPSETIVRTQVQTTASLADRGFVTQEKQAVREAEQLLHSGYRPSQDAKRQPLRFSQTAA